MPNPNITPVSILSVVPVPGTTTATLTYSTGTTPSNNGNVKETVGQGPAKITYVATGAPGAWVVCGCTVMGAVPSDMSIGLQNINGVNTLVVNDTAKDPQQLNFRIQVTNDGGNTVYTSPDPVIINEP